MMTHELKTWSTYFNEVWEGRKRFEIRQDDRGFEVDDTLRLREWRPAPEVYTGREILAKVTSMVDSVPEWGLMDGFCIMSIEVTGKEQKS